MTQGRVVSSIVVLERGLINKKELRELHGLVELVARSSFYYRCFSDNLCGN